MVVPVGLRWKGCLWTSLIGKYEPQVSSLQPDDTLDGTNIDRDPEERLRRDLILLPTKGQLVLISSHCSITNDVVRCVTMWVHKSLCHGNTILQGCSKMGFPILIA